MKAAPFAYHRPSTVDEAVAGLAGGEAKVLAGGQSLVPVLAMRLARPATLVDITAIPELRAISVSGDEVRLGAAVRQQTWEGDPSLSRVPLARLALPWVGHRELRSRGTVCGSLAHADPAAELPAVACCLDATLELTGPTGPRTISARDFFTGPMTTALGPEDLLTAVRFPLARPGEGFGFAELARRHGDFALTGVAVRVRREGDHCADAVLTAFGVSDRPRTTVLRNGIPDHQALTELADELVDTTGDAHGSQAYRRKLFVTLAARELGTAWERSAA